MMTAFRKKLQDKLRRKYGYKTNTNHERGTVFEGKTVWINDEQITGFMPNTGETHTISAGYHDGSGIIVAKGNYVFKKTKTNQYKISLSYREKGENVIW